MSFQIARLEQSFFSDLCDLRVSVVNLIRVHCVNSLRQCSVTSDRTRTRRLEFPRPLRDEARPTAEIWKILLFSSNYTDDLPSRYRMDNVARMMMEATEIR